MKLGGSVLGSWSTPGEFLALLQQSQFAAITCPVDSRTDPGLAGEVIAAIREAGVLIAEAGVWKNLLSSDQEQAGQAFRYAVDQLRFAHQHGIPCVVNVAGSPGERWDGPHRGNYSQAGYEALVRSVQEVIDSAGPGPSCYSLEPMPWMLPDGPDEYLQLIEDIDRPGFKVHLDFTNMINSPRRFLFANEFIEECLMKLGPHTISTHLKDCRMLPEMPFMAKEVPPGQGQLDLVHICQLLHQYLPVDAPVLLEHMHSAADYQQAYQALAQAAQQAGVPIR